MDMRVVSWKWITKASWWYREELLRGGSTVKDDLVEVAHFFHVIAEKVILASDMGETDEWDVETIHVEDDSRYPIGVPLVTWDEQGELVVYWYAKGGPAVYRPKTKYLRDWADHIWALIADRGGS